MTRAIVLDEEAVNILSSAILEESWFKSFKIPEKYRSKICSVEQNKITYLISSSATMSSRLLVIETESNGFLNGVTGKDLVTAFERSLVVALSQFRKTISPGRSWGKYIQRNVISIYATNRNSNDSLRLYFDSSPIDTNHIYLYRVSEKLPSPDITSNEEEIFIDAVSEFESALEKCSYDNTQKKGRKCKQLWY